jgi:hypothetical protein
MSTKAEKLNEVYEYLRLLGKVHTKKEFASEIGVAETNMSSAFNNNAAYLTDNLFRKICCKYPDLLNIDYFLKDVGTMKNTNGNSNTSVAGIGNRVTNASITELIELQKGYQEIIRIGQTQLSESQDQINRLLTLIEKLK